MRYGLSEAQLKEIRFVIAYYPEVEKATLFGSRAMGLSLMPGPETTRRYVNSTANLSVNKEG